LVELAVVERLRRAFRPVPAAGEPIPEVLEPFERPAIEAGREDRPTEISLSIRLPVGETAPDHRCRRRLDRRRPRALEQRFRPRPARAGAGLRLVALAHLVERGDDAPATLA